MTTSEKVAYLKGLAEGMGIQEDAPQGKLFKVIIDILEDLALDLADTKDSVVDLTDSVEAVSEELTELQDDFYESPCASCGGCDEDEEEDEEEDEDEEDFEDVYYSMECPHCSARLTLNEDSLDLGSFECPECGEIIDLSTVEMEEVEFDDDDEDDDSSSQDEIPF